MYHIAVIIGRMKKKELKKMLLNVFIPKMSKNVLCQKRREKSLQLRNDV